MKILTVVGTRPEFVKLALVGWALRDRRQEHIIGHSGQHYDQG